MEFRQQLISHCELEIQVPFKPDGERPVFCKECFKDHQRTLAKSKEREVPEPVVPKKEKVIPPKKATPTKKEEPEAMEEDVVITNKEKSMTLSQLKHVAPKKFTHSSKKPNIDLSSIRNIISKTRKEDK